MSEPTYWNGERCQARLVIGIVDKAPRKTWWCAGLEGQQREVVEVSYGGQKIYLDNEALESEDDPRLAVAGSGWRKVTLGRGSPQWGHRSVPIKRVVRVASRSKG